MSIIRKNIDLPFSTVEGLILLAAQTGTNTKNLMEEILVKYEAKVNHKNSHNYKLLNTKPKSKK